MERKISSGLRYIISVMQEEYEKLYSGRCRLTLTPGLLEEIYRELSDSSFSNEDLKRLCNGVQALRIVPDIDARNACDTFHLAPFQSLTYLEFKNVAVSSVLGLALFRSRLQYLVVSTNACSTLAELLVECGGDKSPDSFLWNELQSLTVTKSPNLVIDSAIGLAHWLRVADFSCNCLCDNDIRNLNALPSLVQLDCSFNSLSSVPLLSSSTSLTMKILDLRHNFIEKLDGLEQMCVLEELDLSSNCIADEGTLTALSSLPKLGKLSLVENPISFHRDYRNLVVQYLNPSVTRKFELDKQPLSVKERDIVGLKAPPTSLLIRSVSRGLLTPAVRDEAQAENNSLCESVERTPSFKLTPRKVGSARRRLREAEIAEAGIMEEVVTATVHTPGEEEHLATKQKLEELRKTFGNSDWLHSQAGNQVSELLGWAQESVETKNMELENEIFNQKETTEPSTTVSRDRETRESSVVVMDSDATNNELIPDSMQSSGIGLQEEPSDDDDEAGQHVFVAHLEFKGNRIERIMTVSIANIREKDALTGQTICIWRTSSLQAIRVLSREPQIRFSLKFPGSVTSSSERMYTMEENDFSEFQSLVTSLVDVNKDSEKAEMLHCVKCSNEFPRSQALVKLRVAQPRHQPEEITVCPQCGSEMVFTLEESKGTSASVLDSAEAQTASEPRINREESECSVEVVDQSTPPKKSSESTQSVASKSSTSLSSLPANSILYSYADFSQVDHRLRLFCEMSLLSEACEEFFGLVKGSMLTTSDTEQPAILVITSHRFYVLKIIGSESEQPDKWLQKVASYRLSQLVCLMTILGSQGFILQFSKDSSLFLYLFLLRDEKRTKNFLQFFSEIMERMQQKKSLVDLSANQKVAVEGLVADLSCDPAVEAAENQSEAVESFVMCCSVELPPTRMLESGCALLIGAENISLISGDFRWLLSHKVRLEAWGVSVASQQPIINLVSLESFISRPEKLRLYFLDETSGTREQWTVTLATRESVDQLVDALRSPWEAIFSVELDVNELDE